jgi:hypothetical protein
MRNDPVVRHFLERLKGLAEGDDIFETLSQDLAQCDTADRPRGVCSGLLGTREIDREQSAQLVIKKRDDRADLGEIRCSECRPNAGLLVQADAFELLCCLKLRGLEDGPYFNGVTVVQQRVPFGYL